MNAQQLLKFIDGIYRMDFKEFAEMYKMAGKDDPRLFTESFYNMHNEFVEWLGSIDESDLDFMIKFVNDGIKHLPEPEKKNFCIYEKRLETKGNNVYKTPVKRKFTDYREMWFATMNEAKQFIKDNKSKLYNDRLCKGLMIYDANRNVLINIKKEA